MALPHTPSVGPSGERPDVYCYRTGNLAVIKYKTGTNRQYYWAPTADGTGNFLAWVDDVDAFGNPKKAPFPGAIPMFGPVPPTEEARAIANKRQQEFEERKARKAQAGWGDAGETERRTDYGRAGQTANGNPTQAQLLEIRDRLGKLEQAIETQHATLSAQIAGLAPR